MRRDAAKRLARSAARATHAPIGLLTIRSGSSTSLAAFGAPELDALEHLDEDPFQVAELDGVQLVHDVRADSRLANAGLASLAPEAAALAVAPVTCEGNRVGSLVVMDVRPREWTAADAESLCDFAAIAADEVEMRERRLAEVASERRTNALLHGMLEHFPNGYVAIFDRDTRIVAAGGRSAHLSAADVVGRTIREVLGDVPYAVATEAAYRKVFEGESSSAEQTFGGEVLLVHRRPIRTGDGAIVAGLVVCQDITPRAKAEAALRQSEERYRALFEKTGDAIYIAEPEGDLVGRILDLNPAAVALHGYSREEMLEKTLYSLRAPGQPLLPVEMRRRALDGGWVRASVVHANKQGARFPVELTVGSLDIGGARHFLVILRDFTERVRAEAALRESEERYRALFEKVGEAILVLDGDGRDAGVILEVNDAAVRLYGYSREELLGKRTDLFAPGGQAALEARRRVLEGAWLHVQVEHRKKDGTRLPVEAMAGPIEIGGRRRIISIIYDITERRRTEEALREAKDAADVANRAKSAFLANMSHEIRTPMNAIVGYSQLLQRDLTLRPEQREQLGIIQRAGDHLLALINDVLEISKIEAGHRVVHAGEVEIRRLLRELDTMFQLRARAKELELTVRIAPDLPLCIVGDETRLRQVLVNLIGNALKFTSAGSVAVRAACIDDGAGAQDFVVEVEDTGPGIDPETLHELFKPFSQGRAGIEAQGGTGLGLAISREHARMMGGDITVTSRVGAGSLFRFSCPCREIELTPAAPAAPLGRVAGIVDTGVPWRALIVDDDKDSRGWLRLLLADVGFEVHEAANGLEGLGLVASWRPHVVLMDVNMPVMSGYDAMRAIRAMPRDQQPSLIAVTATAFDDQQSEIRAAGADAVLRKPCREEDIFQELERQLGVTYTRAAPTAEIIPPTPATATPLRAEMVLALCKAAKAADYERLIDLIVGIGDEHGALAASLRELLARYAYDEIEARVRA